MGKTIVFNTVRTYETPMIVELFLARCLSLLGNTVYLFFDDGVLPHWDSLQYDHHSSSLTPYFMKGVRARRYDHVVNTLMKSIFRTRGTKFLHYSSIIGDIKDWPALNMSDMNHAKASVTRYFKTNLINLDEALYKDYLNLSLKNAQFSKALGRYIHEEINPDLFITSHGIYSTWGPCYDYLKRRNVPSIVHGINGTKGQTIYLYDTIRRFSYQDSGWRKFRNTILDPHQREAVTGYFDDRISLSANDNKVYFSKQELESFRYTKNNEIVIGIFPGVTWDGDVETRNVLFDDLVQWLSFSIASLKNSRHRLVIRFHPSEATLLKGEQSLEYLLRDTYGNLDDVENLTVISSDQKINTYDVICKHIDIAVIYDGTLGFELTYLKTPVISCSRSRYTDTGIVIEPATQEEYRSMLEHPETVIKRFSADYNKIYENLLSYAYWWFFESVYHMPVLDPAKYNCVGHAHLSRKKLDITQNSDLRRTIDKIVTYRSNENPKTSA